MPRPERALAVDSGPPVCVLRLLGLADELIFARPP
jgi:hypothetical protein